MFLVLLAAVIVGGWWVLRWYATSNFIVQSEANHVVIVQGREGGFLWWKPKVVVTERYGLAQLPYEIAVLVQKGVDEPTLSDAKNYVNNMHAQWETSSGHATTTTTSTTTTFPSGNGGT